MDDLLSSTKKAIISHDLVKSGDFLIVGVSGGPDSMALLAVLSILKNDLGFKIAGAHLNHGLRAEADDDAALVRKICEQYNLRYFEKRVELEKIAQQANLGIEEAGREARRSFFEECRAEIASEVKGRVLIALAHHKQDQAETIIFNLARGSGLSGLSGMKMIDFPYIRPFLMQEKQTIMDWLEQHNIPWQHDHTNSETVYMRNRIRHLLLPYWHKVIGYDPVTAIVRAGNNLTVDNECLEQLTEEAYARSCSDDDNSLNCELLLQYHAAIRVRVLKKYFLKKAGTVKDLDHKHIDLLRRCLEAGEGPFDLPYNLIVRCYSNKLQLIDRVKKPDDNDYDDWSIDLCIEGLTELPAGLGQIEAIRIEYNPDFRYNSQMNCFRADRLRGCKVRFRRPGDRIRPAGRQGSKTLKKFMNEEKIAPLHRDRLPVVADRNEIVWLPDYACGEAYVCDKSVIGAKAVRLIWHQNGSKNYNNMV